MPKKSPQRTLLLPERGTPRADRREMGTVPGVAGPGVVGVANGVRDGDANTVLRWAVRRSDGADVNIEEASEAAVASPKIEEMKTSVGGAAVLGVAITDGCRGLANVAVGGIARLATRNPAGSKQNPCIAGAVEATV
jgi:hypothetical protein